MELYINILRLISFATVVGYVCGFSFGAPWETCLTMFPKHSGAQRQPAACPFIITTNQSSYFPGDTITVTLSSNMTGRTFKGLQIRAHPVNGDAERIVGQFIEWPTNKTNTLDCLGGKQNMVTHSNNIPVSMITLTWMAPNISYGDILFVVSFVEDFNKFWIDQKATITSGVVVTIPSSEQVFPSFRVIDWSQCGEDKGCFLYPRPCTGYDCYAALTYKIVNQSVEFEMFGSQSGYVSVGFSTDKKMGYDETISCTSGDLSSGLQRGYNHKGLYNERQFKAGLVDLESQYSDGRLYCRFTRPLDMFVYVNKGHTDKLNFDLNNDHYLMLAWGHIYDGSDIMGLHKELPPMTHNKVNVREHTIVRGSSLPLTHQIHGTLMLVAWILLVGVVTVIPRYYKNGFGAKKMNGVKAWFQIHRAIAVSLWLLTVGGFVLIFVAMDGLSEEAVAHHYLGIAVMAASSVQVLAGMIRPSLDSKLRPIFNIGHWLLGKLTHITAGITFYYAFDQDIIPKPQRRFANIVLAVWLAQQLLWECLFELNQRCMTVKRYDSYKLSELKKTAGVQSLAHPDSSETGNNSFPGSTQRLIVYILSLMAIEVAALCSIFLF